MTKFRMTKLKSFNTKPFDNIHRTRVRVRVRVTVNIFIHLVIWYLIVQ